MTDEQALRAAVRDNPHDTTPRLVLADHLDELDRPEEAALHRVIARPGDEESVKTLAGYTKGDSREALHHTEVANETENRVRLRGSNNWHAGRHAEDAVHSNPGTADRWMNHGSAAEIHRVHAGNILRRASNIEGEGGHWEREARVLRDVAEHHLTAAALHEAAAYHHRTSNQ